MTEPADPLSIITISFDREHGEVTLDSGDLDWFSTLGLLTIASDAVRDYSGGVTLAGVADDEGETTED